MENSAKDLNADYNVWHSQRTVDSDCNTPWHSKVKVMLRPDRDIENKEILEIGCGRGGFALWLATRPKPPKCVFASDFSEAAVKMGEGIAIDREISNIQWNTGDIQNIGHPNERFDTVISCETIEHVPKPWTAVTELARVLKPGGRLFLTTPNYFNLFGIYRGYLRIMGTPYTEGGQPYNFLVLLPRTLSWVRKSGLRIVDYGSIEYIVPWPGRPPIHIEKDKLPKIAGRWFGLQSYVVAEKQ